MNVKVHLIVTLLATVQIAVSAPAQEIKTEHICTIERQYPNDGDCYGNLFFQFHSQNQHPEGDFHGVSIADLRSGKTLAFTYLGFNPNFHNSSITFTRRKKSIFDPLPLLIASENYAPNEYYKIHVYRVRRRGGSYSFENVRTIDMPSPDSLEILYPHAVPDEDGRHIWIEGYSTDKSKTVFLLFDNPEGFTVKPGMPGREPGMTGVPIRRFEIPRKNVTDQAYCIRKGKFYQVVGVKREAWLRIIDIESGTLEREVLFNDYGLPYEPEAVFFWRGRLCASFSANGKAEVYTVDLL